MGRSDGADPARQTLYAHYATAFLLAHVAKDAAASAELSSDTMSADMQIANVLRASARCAPSSDRDAGGPTPGSGSAPDAGADGSGAPQGAPDGAVSGFASRPASGCGCRSAPTEGTSYAVLVCLVLALRARRRRP